MNGGGLTAPPVLAALLGTPAAGGAADAQETRGVSSSRSDRDPDLAGIPAGPATVSAEGGADPFPLALLLLLMAIVVSAALARPGAHAASGVLAKRSERSIERRQRELVAAVRGILDDSD